MRNGVLSGVNTSTAACPQVPPTPTQGAKAESRASRAGIAPFPLEDHDEAKAEAAPAELASPKRQRQSPRRTPKSSPRSQRSVDEALQVTPPQRPKRAKRLVDWLG